MKSGIRKSVVCFTYVSIIIIDENINHIIASNNVSFYFHFRYVDDQQKYKPENGLDIL